MIIWEVVKILGVILLFVWICYLLFKIIKNYTLIVFDKNNKAIVWWRLSNIVFYSSLLSRKSKERRKDLIKQVVLFFITGIFVFVVAKSFN